MGNDPLIRLLILVGAAVVGMIVVGYSVFMWWAMVATSRYHRKLPEGDSEKKSVSRPTVFLAPILFLGVLILRIFTGIIKAVLLFFALALFPIFLVIVWRKSGIPPDDNKKKEGLLVKIGNYILKGIW